jgi:hypothetical protein
MFDMTDTTKAIMNYVDVFEIEDKVVQALQDTNNEIFPRNIPFDGIFLDVNLFIGDYFFTGIMATRDTLWTYYFHMKERDKMPIPNLPFMQTWTDPEVEILPVMRMIKEEQGFDFPPKHVRKALSIFVCNFLDFINQSAVKTVYIERSKKNQERRARKGKPVLPSFHRIVLSGELKEYIANYSLTGKAGPSKHWVRGHFIRFWDIDRYSSLYKQLEMDILPEKYDVLEYEGRKVIMTWKKPFVRGEGALTKRTYKLVKEEDK